MVYIIDIFGTPQCFAKRDKMFISSNAFSYFFNHVQEDKRHSQMIALVLLTPCVTTVIHLVSQKNRTRYIESKYIATTHFGQNQRNCISPGGR